jgi:benzoate membrane transport protein
MRRDFSAEAFAAGALAAFVGFASSFAVVLSGLRAVGASPAEAASGLLAVSIAMGLPAIYVSFKTRMPISIAWSTPGAALLASTGAPEGGFAAAAGAFLVTGALIVLSGYWRALGQWVAAIPASIANAMLAGVLLGLCLAPVHAIIEMPMVGIAILLSWAVVARFKRLFAVPAAVAVACIAILAAMQPATGSASLWPVLHFVRPSFSLAAILGIALPLFIVTMASQNIPGMAVLAANGYRPELSPLLRITGTFTLLAAPFGGHAVNLAAITAAICAGPEAHPDPARRYWAAVVAGAFYVVLALFAAAATAFVAASPPVLIQAVAGLALIGAFAGAIQGAVALEAEREAAIVTFLVTAGGLSFLGIGGAFWGLLAGGLMLALRRMAPAKAH